MLKAGEVMRVNETEVNNFLNTVKRLLKKKQFILKNRKDGINNLSSYGLSIQDVKEAILSLNYKRYVSGPDEDYNHKGEYVWKFKKCLEGVVYYIKIQIPTSSKILIIISFHPDNIERN